MYYWDEKKFPAAAAFRDIAEKLSSSSRLLLSAETGAGKSTLIPAKLLDEPFLTGKMIIMLEPRRLAARMLADFLAAVRGEKVGETVGFAIRGEKKISARTRLLIVTEGILTRMMQQDMELSGTGLIIFDEFHERHLSGDLGLAMAMDIQENLRPDLKIMVMSATLNEDNLAYFLQTARQVKVPGRTFPLQIFYDETPRFDAGDPSRELWEKICSAVLRQLRRAIEENPGCGILCFLPGAREIAEVHRQLAGNVPDGLKIYELYGSMSGREQNEAVHSPGWKIILATNIAESSVTIENINVVVDSLYERRIEFSPADLMDKLVLRKISRKSAIQRAGRAGRTAPGKVYRCCTGAEFELLDEDPVPEILRCDLANTVLELRCWGNENLRFPDPPPPAALEAGKKLLFELGALDDNGRPTPLGRKINTLPLNARLSAMLIFGLENGALPEAAELCAILGERDFLSRGVSADITLRQEALRRGKAPENVVNLYRDLQKRLRQSGEKNYIEHHTLSPGIILASGCPDRIARQRGRHSSEYLLSGGRGAALPRGDDLVGNEFLVVPAVDGGGKNAFIRLAAPVMETEIRQFFPERIIRENVVEFDPAKGVFSSFELEKFGSLVLKKIPRSNPDAVAEAMLEYLKKRNFVDLAPGRGGENLKKRLEYAGLTVDWGEIIAPYLTGKRSISEVNSLDFKSMLKNSLSHNEMANLEKICPAAVKLPCGRLLEIDYGEEIPTVSSRAQDFYGMDFHPVFGPEKTPLRIELLSPARRPVQITCDLPGFWRGSWALVRKEMKSRYPKHDWPEKPQEYKPERK